MANFVTGVIVTFFLIGGYVFFTGGKNIDDLRNSAISRLNQSQTNVHSTVEKYKQRGEDIRKLLVKTSVNVKVYSQNIAQKEIDLSLLEDQNSTKAKIIQANLTEMKSFQVKLKTVESKLQAALLKHRDGLDLLKMKIDYLESKRDMLAIEQSLNAISSIDESVNSTEREVETFTVDLDREILQLETELEVSKLLEK